MGFLLELGNSSRFVYDIFYWSWGRVVASYILFLLEWWKRGGFVNCIFIGVEEEWSLRIWYLFWSWGIVLASYMGSLLELGKSGGFLYVFFIGVGE